MVPEGLRGGFELGRPIAVPEYAPREGVARALVLRDRSNFFQGASVSALKGIEGVPAIMSFR